MDKLVGDALKKAEALRRPASSVSWKPNAPWAQSFFQWNNQATAWQPVQVNKQVKSSPSITAVSVYSWNIDFMLPYAEPRMAAALAHLQTLTSQLPSSTAWVIGIQECTTSDLTSISETQWIRDNFYITDLDTSSWSSGLYGTTMLLDRRLGVSSCSRIHYAATQMQRDLLSCDFNIPGSSKSMRVATTHLESLAVDPPRRPAQMQRAATYLKAEGDNLAGSVVVGDFNAIQPFDKTLHSDNGLKDAYLETGGKEDSEEGFTWGQQALPDLRKRFGCTRMDKAFFCGPGIELQSFERFGAGIELPESNEVERLGILALGFEKPWITDHLGIRAVFGINNESKL